MKRKSIVMSLIFVCCLFFWFSKTEQAQAATNLTSINAEASVNGSLTRVAELRTVGGTEFRMEIHGGFFSPTTKKLYAYKNKKCILIASSDGVNSDLDDQIVTDGKKVYYSKTVFTKSLTGQQVPKRIRVYRVTIGKKSKEICSMKAYVGNQEIAFCMMGIYGGKIIYCDGREDIYSYSIKSGKHKELYSMRLDTDRIRQYNNFIYFQGGLWGTAGTVEILNAKNGRVIELSEDVMTEYKRVMYDELQRANYDIVNGKLYYLEFVKKGGDNPYGGSYSYVAVKKCNPNGSGKRTLIKKLAVSHTKMAEFKRNWFTKKNWLTYYNANGRKRMKRLK